MNNKFREYRDYSYDGLSLREETRRREVLRVASLNAIQRRKGQYISFVLMSSSQTNAKKAQLIRFMLDMHAIMHTKDVQQCNTMRNEVTNASLTKKSLNAIQRRKGQYI